MDARRLRGCVVFLGTFLVALLLSGLLLTLAVAIAAGQPRGAWPMAVGDSSIVIGRIVVDDQCRHLQEEGWLIGCRLGYGAVLYRPGRSGRPISSALLAIPDSWLRL